MSKIKQILDWIVTILIVIWMPIMLGDILLLQFRESGWLVIPFTIIGAVVMILIIGLGAALAAYLTAIFGWRVIHKRW